MRVETQEVKSETESFFDSPPKTDLTLTSLIDSITNQTLHKRVKEFIQELPEPDIEQGISTDIERVNKVLAPCILTEEQYSLLITKLGRGKAPLIQSEKIRMLITTHRDHLLENTLKAIVALHYLQTTGNQQIEVLRQGKPTVIDFGKIDIPLFCLTMALNLLKGNFDDPHGGGDPRERVPQGTTTQGGKRRPQVIKIF